MFLFPVSRVKTTVVKAATTRKVCASPEVLGGLERGRHAISISADDTDIYVGGDDVTATNGVVVKQGTTMVIPTDRLNVSTVYAIGGTFRLGEYF